MALTVAESATLPYATRRTGPAAVSVALVTSWLLVGAFPARDTGRALGVVRELYPQAEPATHVLEAALYNGNPLSHPLPCLLNAGRIEHAGDSFHLYQQGITPAVARAMAALDEERLAVCRALGLLELPVGERLERLGYVEPGPSLGEQYNSSAVFAPISGPTSLGTRYLSEDIPYGLVLWHSLGETLGIDMPVCGSVIDLAGQSWVSTIGPKASRCSGSASLA